MINDKKIYITAAGLFITVILVFLAFFFITGAESMAPSEPGRIYELTPGRTLKLDSGWSAYSDQQLESSADVTPKIFGTGNYFFKLILKTENLKGQNAFLISPLFSASRLWVNGELLQSNGVPGEDSEELAMFKNRIIPYTQSGDDLEIVLQVSNHSSLFGGSQLNWLTYGRFEDVVRHSRQGRTVDFLFTFGLSSFALIHLFNYFYQRRFRYSVFLFLYLFLYAIFTVFSGRMIITDFIPVISGELIIRIHHIVVVLAFPVMMNYIRSLFPDEVKKPALITVQIISLAVAAAMVFVPMPLARFFTMGYSILKAAGGLYLIYCIIAALRNDRKGAVFALVSFSVLMVCLLNDLLNTLVLISTVRLMFAGLFFFAVIQTIRLIFDSIEDYRSSEEASRKLKAVLEQKETFFSRNSIELDKPIRNILELSESLLKGSIGPMNSEQIATSSLIVSNGVRLSNMLNDILDFTRIKDDEVEIRKGAVNFNRVAQKVVNSCDSLIAVRDIKLSMEIESESCYVEADERRLEQVLYSLVSNSIRHTDKGSIVIKGQDNDGRFDVVLVVTGSDLDEDRVRNIFSAYEQGVNEGIDEQNISDLSFAIARKLLELHGASIDVETVDEKLQYRFELDCWQGERPLTEEEVLEMDALINLQPVFDEITSDRNIEVLISGKDVEELQILKSQLSTMNYSVVPMLSGAELIARVKETLPHLVVIDVKLSDMSGYEVCSEIRKVFSKDELPVILVINKEDVSEMMEGLTSGANDFLTRPYLQEEFLTRVNTHLQLARISHVYSRFVPTEFLNSLGQDNIVDVELGDQVSKEMTILFVDIRAFTSLSENMTPEENFKFINSYLSRFSPMITNNGGFVDKYIGDAIMALFPHSPEDALAAAKEMIEHVNVYNGHRANCGYNPIGIGVGIHTGNMILGIIGDEKRMQGTVISDAVNLASRIQDVTKLYKANVVISQDTFVKLENASDYNYRFLGRVRVKGKDNAVALFEIFDSDSEDDRELKKQTSVDFEQAIMHFSQKEFKDAKDHLLKVTEINPNDETAKVFLNRIDEIQREEKRDFLKSL